MGNRLRPLNLRVPSDVANETSQRTTKPPGKEGLVAVKVHKFDIELGRFRVQARAAPGRQRPALHAVPLLLRGTNGGDEVLVVCRCALGRGCCPVMTWPVITWISVESLG